LHGDRDWLFSVELPIALYRRLPDAELWVLPQTGHSVHGQRPDWFQAIVLEVLEFFARRVANSDQSAFVNLAHLSDGTFARGRRHRTPLLSATHQPSDPMSPPLAWEPTGLQARPGVV
jgi:hypothetical protein